ncbi:MAG TPA: hypothetical protein VK485_00535 [Sphingomicrobium sp.]|nr:hypothetical protein [Sphingomicrobium sp.]
MRTSLALIIGTAALSLSACADANGAYGVGYASGYDSPGFDCYNGPYGYGYGGYSYDNCGWYDGSFYPGFGNFVFDRDHHRHNMTGRQHDYFTRQARGPDGGRRVGLGSSGGVVPPTMSQPQGMPRNGMSSGFGPGPRVGIPGAGNGFGGGGRGGFGGSRGGSFGGSRGGSGHRG